MIHKKREGNIKSIITIIFFIFTTSLLHAEINRTKYNFNHAWKLKVGDIAEASKRDFDDSDWISTTLPYAWNQSEAFKNDIVDLSTGIAWYRKSFQLPEDAETGKVFIEFEGVRQMGEVYVNSHFIGRSENGVMAFGFDITPFLSPFPAQNIIAVKTNNDWEYREKLSNSKYQWSNKNFNANYGGIPKNVYLHITPKVYQTLPLYSSLGTTGTYIYGTHFDIKNKVAVIHTETQVRNESKQAVDVQMEVTIEELDGKIIAKFPGEYCTLSPGGMRNLSAVDSVRHLHFWSSGYGYLYNVFTDIKIDGKLIDRVITKTGFRKTHFGEGMIALNDRVIMMKGYAQRTSNEWPSVGMSVPSWLSDYSNSLIIEGNGNMVRWMHVTPWKQDIESCDRVGLIQAMPAGDAERDVSGRRWQQRTELMRDAIIYNRNNPSILFYECGNESISEEHMAEMLAIKNQYDPNGGRAIGSREMLDSKVAEYGGEMLYINKSAKMPFWAMEYCRDEGLRKYWDNFTPPYHKDGEGPLYKGKDASEYNHNQDSHAIENVIRWYDYWEMRPGTGKRVSSGGANIVFSDTNTHHRGSENYRRSGEVDAMRIPKEGFWAHQVIWNGWSDTDSSAIYILGHWNYKAGVVKDVTVVSTADDVELFINNKSLGKGKQSKRFLFTFENVAFKPGTLKAVGYSSGEKQCLTTQTTAEEPEALKLSVIHRPGGMLADGQDLALVQVEVVDKNGKRCPTALNMVTFEVNGSGEYLGGIAQGPENYIGAATLPVECGVNRIFIRSKDIPGSIKVKVKSEGFKSTVLSLETLKTDKRHLSTVMPDNGLPSYLKKGETPNTASYTVSRIPVAIHAAKSVVNEENAVYSYDDNEMTEWRNDGRLATGIIEYELEREGMLNQVVLKLSGWRTRSYPIKIYIDDQLVYNASTPNSLGYTTCTFSPTQGKKVRIELSGATSDNETFNIVEITGKTDKAGLEGDNAKGSLRIVEIECYEAIQN